MGSMIVVTVSLPRFYIFGCESCDFDQKRDLDRFSLCGFRTFIREENLQHLQF